MRMRPTNNDEEEGEAMVQKISSDSLSILGQTFTFDSVADTESTQARFNAVLLSVGYEYVFASIQVA